MKQALVDNFKNAISWKTKRKLVVIAVDDYGNVRVDSKKAKEKLIKEGLKLSNRFDQFDALETGSDLTALYDVLQSVKDKNGNHAIFSALALPVNIDYEKMRENGYNTYFYEKLPKTFDKLKGYEDAWDIWQQGIKERLLVPEFHGREHFNLKVFEDNLKSRDKNTLVALENRSYTAIGRRSKNVSFTAAFHFEDRVELEKHKEIIRDGLNLFEEAFGFRASVFNPPGGRENEELHETLAKNGIKYLETPMIKNEHQGEGVYKTKFYRTGKRNKLGQTFTVRNAVFEPTSSNQDWVASCLKQIQTAFRWNCPAIISSHRVNFCGHIDENNRKKGLSDLQVLLKRIVDRWPDVEFMSIKELDKLIVNEF